MSLSQELLLYLRFRSGVKSSLSETSESGISGLNRGVDGGFEGRDSESEYNEDGVLGRGGVN